MTIVPVACGIILRNKDHKILLAERPAGKHLAGLLEFPGGKIEPGESQVSALKRELREELALEVEVLHNLGVFPFAYDTISIALHTLVVRARGAPHTTADVARFCWLDPRLIDLSTLSPADHEPWRVFTTLTRGDYS